MGEDGLGSKVGSSKTSLESLQELCPKSVTFFPFPRCAALLTLLFLKSGLMNHFCHQCLSSLKDQLLMWLKVLSAATQTSTGSRGNSRIALLSSLSLPSSPHKLNRLLLDHFFCVCVYLQTPTHLLKWCKAFAFSFLFFHFPNSLISVM